VPADGPEGGEGELLDRALDVGHRIKGLPRYSNMIINRSINLNLDVVPGQCLEPVDVDNVGLHVDDVDLVGEGVEVLQA